MTTLDKKAAFLHVIDSHRWLAASGCAWNLAGANASWTTREESYRVLPNIDVMIRDCLLLHARALIKFYRGSKKGCTDIVLSDFGNKLQIQQQLDAYLDTYERPIEVHLLHLTDWRDVGYRNSHSVPRGTTVRPNWDQEASVIAEKLIFECLEYASRQSGAWQRPFQELYKATAERYQDGSYSWPTNLCEESDVTQYLAGLGL